MFVNSSILEKKNYLCGQNDISMINRELIQPESIVVVGGSNNYHKPGGAIVRNIIQGGFEGTLRIVNPKEDEVQGIKVFHDVTELPPTELAILVIPAKMCPDAVRALAAEKGVKAFIIISAGFGEETEEGARLEADILETCSKYDASLIGPNCIGLLNNWHHSVFTKPIPNLNPKGVDFISGSGATAVFILESAVMKGLQFNSVWSIGNGKQIGIEDVLQYMDENFNPDTDPTIKLLYVENISNPDKLLFHASSLIRKGCRIAAIKSGSSESGSRAASSHTGAIASSDSAVEALFRKAGIVRCFSREELTTVAAYSHVCLQLGDRVEMAWAVSPSSPMQAVLESCSPMPCRKADCKCRSLRVRLPKSLSRSSSPERRLPTRLISLQRVLPNNSPLPSTTVITDSTRWMPSW